MPKMTPEQAKEATAIRVIQNRLSELSPNAQAQVLMYVEGIVNENRNRAARKEPEDARQMQLPSGNLVSPFGAAVHG